jgi:hypothetical protein
VDVEHPLGGRHDAKHAGGGSSQPEERHGLAAEVLIIDRHMKKPASTGVVSAPGIFVDGALIHVFN